MDAVRSSLAPLFPPRSMVKPACGAGVSHARPTVMPNVDPSIISCSLEFFRLFNNTIRLARPVREETLKKVGYLQQVFFKQQTIKTVRQRTKDLFGPVRLKENSTCGVIRLESIQ